VAAQVATGSGEAIEVEDIAVLSLGLASGAPQRQFNFSLADSPAYGGGYGETFIRAFIRAVPGQGPLPAAGQDALQVARMAEAAYQSNRTGQRVLIA